MFTLTWKTIQLKAFMKRRGELWADVAPLPSRAQLRIERSREEHAQPAVPAWQTPPVKKHTRLRAHITTHVWFTIHTQMYTCKHRHGWIQTHNKHTHRHAQTPCRAFSHCGNVLWPLQPSLTFYIRDWYTETCFLVGLTPIQMILNLRAWLGG